MLSKFLNLQYWFFSEKQFLQKLLVHTVVISIIIVQNTRFQNDIKLSARVVNFVFIEGFSLPDE